MSGVPGCLHFVPTSDQTAKVPEAGLGWGLSPLCSMIVWHFTFITKGIPSISYSSSASVRPLILIKNKNEACIWVKMIPINMILLIVRNE